MKTEESSTYPKQKVFKALKDALLGKDEIIFAYLHGSFLDGLLFKDIDIALYLDDKKVGNESNEDYCDRLSMELSELIRFVVDVHIMNRAPAGFQHSVFKHGELLFSKDDELRTDLMEETSMEIMDYYEISIQSIRDMVYDDD